MQQGMRPEAGSARRYHWLGARVGDFVNEPHAAVCADERGGPVLNLVAAESAGARDAIHRLTTEQPERVLREVRRAPLQLELLPNEKPTPAPAPAPTPVSLAMPRRHPVVVREDVDPKRLATILLGTYMKGSVTFEQVLGTPGVGAKNLRALALVAELLYGEKASTRDPARFSFAHGGKDGTPFPVDRKTYDESVEWLRVALERARLGRTDRIQAMKRLAGADGAAPAAEG